MTGKCPKCRKEYGVPNHRGSRVGNYRCPDCRVQLVGVTAGLAKGRYWCPVGGYVVTLGTTGVQLNSPYRVVYRPGLQCRPCGPRTWAGARERMISDTVAFQYWPDNLELTTLARVGGRILGPGCVVSRSLALRRDDFSPAYAKGRTVAGLRLVPVDTNTTDPADWIVNEPVKYGKCIACGTRTADVPQCRPEREWRPRKTYVWRGRGRRAYTVDVDQGPHPAGSLACFDCDPQTLEELA